MAEQKAKARDRRPARADRAAQEPPKTPERVNIPPARQAATYTATEIAQAAHVFGTNPEVVLVALKEKGVTHTTEAEARAIVAAFLERKV